MDDLSEERKFIGKTVADIRCVSTDVYQDVVDIIFTDGSKLTIKGEPGPEHEAYIEISFGGAFIGADEFFNGLTERINKE